MDSQEIYHGQAWDMKIKSALIHSKIMVSVFSPAYFHSDWCKKEFAVMSYRQQQCGYCTLDNPNSLIVPIKIADGEHFPSAATSLQIGDFNDFSWTGIEGVPLFVDFQKKLRKWVESVAHAHNCAPDWNEDWKHPDWLAKSWADIDKLNPSSSKTAPKL